MRNILVIVLIISSLAADIRVYGQKYNVTIYSALPDNSKTLRIHVFSGDNELGYHNLKVGETFSWTFERQVFGKTAFFGHFWWDKFEKGVAVFNASVERICGESKKTLNFCWWQIEKNGFYLANVVLPSNGLLEKVDDWDYGIPPKV